MAKDKFTRSWITENAVEIIRGYEDGVLTIRALHYQLVSRGMTNTTQHYKRVVGAMGMARREGLISYHAFSDHDREMIGVTRYEVTDLDEAVSDAKNAIQGWMKYYSKNRWENQEYYPEVFIEKKALQGVFGPICQRHRVALGACKGYPSLTFLRDVSERFTEAEQQGKKGIILYFGDHDPSGEDIPRSIGQNLLNDFGVEVEVRIVALNRRQVIEMNLPPAPAKKGDSRTANFDGLGQVELDAVPPEVLRKMCEAAILSVFDEDAHRELMNTEEAERSDYVRSLKDYVKTL